MKHLLNNLSESEKNRILEQYNNSLTVDTSKFKKLLESKLGNVKPLLNEGGPSNNPTKAPFKNNEEANKFRQWVNQKYNQTAKNTLDLDPTGNKPDSYYNYHIQRAWNYIPGTFGYTGEGETLGQEYSNLSKTTNQTSYMDYWDELSNIGSETKTESKPTTVPFKNKTEGNEFRAWVIKNFPKVATATQLSPTGEYNNSYITNAWNYKVDGKTLGELYNSPSSTTSDDNSWGWMDNLKNDKSNIQTDQAPLKQICPKITNTSNLERFDTKNKTQSQLNDINATINRYSVEYTNQGIPTRISCQAALNKIRPGFKDKNLIIVDSREHLIYIYDKNNKFIAKDVVITGAHSQSQESQKIASAFVTIEEWITKQGYTQIKPIDVFKYKGALIGDWVDSKGNLMNKQKMEDLGYDMLTKMGTRFLPKGIYGTTDTKTDSHYTGGENNIVHIKKGDKIISQAIHGYFKEESRTVALNAAKKLLSDPTNPSVSKEFLKAANLKQINLSHSYGCINVPERMVPYLEKYIADSYVFNIGEDQNNYLVQNSETFFKKMEEPFCPSPQSFGAEIPAEFNQMSNMS